MPGMLAAALGGLDAFVFTAGIGENSADDARAHREKLGWLGAELDAGRQRGRARADLARRRAASRSTSCRPTRS